MVRLRGLDKNGLGGGAAPSGPTLGNIFTVGPSDARLFFMSDNGQGLLLVSEEFPIHVHVFASWRGLALYHPLYHLQGAVSRADSR